MKPMHAASTVASFWMGSRGDVLNDVCLKSSRSFPSPPWQLHLQIQNDLSRQNLHLLETTSATAPFDVFQREGFVDAHKKPFFLTPIFHILTVIRGSQQAEQWAACSTLS